MNPKQHGKLTLVLLLLVAAAIVGSYFLPFSKQAIHEDAQHSRMVLTVAMTAAMCAAAVLFLRGASVFRPSLQAAYRWFAIGLVLFGIALLQWPFTVYFGETKAGWATSGLVVIPFILATAFMYIGMRLFARVLSAQSPFVSLKVALPIVIFVTGISGITAHWFSRAAVNTADGNTYTATVAWSLSFGLLAWLLVLRIRHAIGEEYKYSINWLAIALGMLVFSGVHEYITSYLFGENDVYVHNGFSLWPFIISGFLFIYAGHLFNNSGYQEGAVVADSTSDGVYINSVTSIAKLVSKPADIQPILDDLWKVASVHQAGDSLTEGDRAQLLGMYVQLEMYLTTADPLRTFTKEQLRKRVAPTFRTLVNQQLRG